MGIKYQTLKAEDEEWVKFSESISFKTDAADSKPENFIKVPFKEALSLVGRRQIFINKGIAYVPIHEVFSIACSHFRYRLYAELMKAYKVLPMILKDTRV